MVAVSARGNRRRRRWLIATVIVAVVAVWALVLGVKTLSAYHHDRDGLAALEQIKANLTPGQLTSSATERVLDQASAQFASAHADLSSPFFAPVTVIPVIGRQFRAIRALGTAAGTVSQVGSTFLSEVTGLLNQPHSAGPERVASLRQLGAYSLSAERQLVAVDTGPSQALVAPLASKRNEFVTQLNDARLRLVKAAVTLSDLSPSGDHTLPVGAVSVTGDLQRNWGWLHPSLDMRNLGLTPQFDVTAPLAARMWTASTGQQVDGVIALDVVGISQLLDATGPVQSDGRTFTAGNVEQFLLHDQYAGLNGESAITNNRQDDLGDLAGAVLNQLQGQSTDLKTLANAVSSAVAGRHLMIWSKNPVDQAAWVVSGVSGSLTNRSVDVSLINVGGNKLDQFIAIHVALSTKPVGSNTEVSLTAQLANTTPPGQSQYIAGPFPGVPVAYGGYYGLVAANLPAAASDITMVGGGPLAVKGGEGPTWVVGAPLTIPAGSDPTVVVRFQMPGPHGSMTVVPSARVPAEVWTANGRTFDDSMPTTITW